MYAEGVIHHLGIHVGKASNIGGMSGEEQALHFLTSQVCHVDAVLGDRGVAVVDYGRERILARLIFTSIPVPAPNGCVKREIRIQSCIVALHASVERINIV
eukprot:XP_001704179.1 Hypothetical protein GL50803_39749 [Giardia lamblia ATCC 50803]